MRWWHPDALARRRPYLEARMAIIADLCATFAQRGFIEVETPALQVSPGLEPHLHAFATEIVDPDGTRRPLYLHTSPEFAMKKLLAGGVGPCFQLARVFRNGERSATHHPEFTMLEWYRPHAGWRDLLPDCEALLRAACRGRPFTWNGAEADPHADWEHLSVADAFRRHAGLDLEPVLDDTPGFARAAAAIGIATQPHDAWDDIFFRIFLARIEPHLGVGAPTVLYAYPASMAALARLDSTDPRWAERFELYVCGLELANGFGELTDAVEQRRRFKADMATKHRLYGSCYPIDADFLAAVAAMPPAAGIALGVDRLVMLSTGAGTIEEVLWAPVA